MTNLIKKYPSLLLVVAVVLITANVIFLKAKFQTSLVPTYSEEMMKNHPLLKKNLDETVVDVREKAKSLPNGSFTSGSSEKIGEIFENFFHEIKTAEVFRIKVWDRNYTVIWSNASELIGKSYPDNHEVEEALEGKIEVEIKKGKSEHYTERSYSNYSELYIPIKDDSGKIIGVIETYKVIEDVVSALREDFYKTAAASFGLSLVIFVIAAVGLKTIVL